MSQRNSVPIPAHLTHETAEGTPATSIPASSNVSIIKPASEHSAESPHHGQPSLEKGIAAAEPAAPPRNVSGFSWFLVVVAILSSTFLFALDNTVVADVQPAIIETFPSSIPKLPWLSVAFLLGAVASNLIWGKIYGQFNAKWLYVFTVFLFELGSALCGAANTMNTLIVGRVICGLGGAGMYVGVMTLLSVTTTPHERPTYIGMTGLTWGAGTVLGPIIGGAFADNANTTWRWAFYINLVIGGVFAPVYLFLLPSYDPRPGVAYSHRLAQLDYFGTTLITGALTSGVMAVSFGGITYAWASATTIGLFVCSGVLFILFALQQVFAILTTEEHRIFPLQFLKSRTMLLLFAQTATAVATLLVSIYFIPIFFQFVRNDSALKAGVRLLPLVVLLVFFCLLNGGMLSKYGFYMPWYLWGGVLSVIGGALFYTVDEHTSTAAIYGYSVILGIGAGSYCQASFSVAQAKVKPDEIPSAVGFITLAQIGGGTISLAIANSVFLNQATGKIAALLPDVPLETVRGAVAGGGSAFFRTLSDDIKAKVLHIVVEAISRVYILVITAGALAVVLSVFMKRERLFMEAAGAG